MSLPCRIAHTGCSYCMKFPEEYKDMVISESKAMNYPVRHLYRVIRGNSKNTYEKIPLWYIFPVSVNVLSYGTRAQSRIIKGCFLPWVTADSDAQVPVLQSVYWLLAVLQGGRCYIYPAEYAGDIFISSIILYLRLFCILSINKQKQPKKYKSCNIPFLVINCTEHEYRNKPGDNPIPYALY